MMKSTDTTLELRVDCSKNGVTLIASHLLLATPAPKHGQQSPTENEKPQIYAALERVRDSQLSASALWTS